MFQEILEKNLQHIQSQKAFRKFESELQRITSGLNEKKIITLSGIKHSGKTKLIAELLSKTNTLHECFYFDSDLDSLGSIKKYEDLMTLIELYIKLHGAPKIIVLKNTSNIEGIKKCISQIYSSKKYKLIIAGNNIHIDGVTNIELFPLTHDFKSRDYIYGGIPEVRIVPDANYKTYILSALKNDILLKDVIEPYNIKNITLYYNIISFIAHDSKYRTMREIHRMLKDTHVEVSLLTLIEYINAALNTRLLHRVYRYDLKKSSTIESKAQYYFGDSGIGTSFGHTQKSAKINALYILLLAKGYSVHGGTHGRFHFDFRATSHHNTCMIHFTQESDKNEVRKIARKLGKIPHRCGKYLIVEDKTILGMRKFIEEGVVICEASELVEYI